MTCSSYPDAVCALSLYICTVKHSSYKSCVPGVRWSVFSFALSPVVILHRVHEACKRAIWTAGDNCCAFLVFKPLKPTFDFPLLSALHWYHLAGIESLWAGAVGRGGQGNHGVLHCLINHANQCWGVRGPLTCSETPQIAILLRAQTQQSTSHRWGKAKKTGVTQRQTQEQNTCADGGMRRVDKIWIHLPSYAAQIHSQSSHPSQDCPLQRGQLCLQNRETRIIPWLVNMWANITKIAAQVVGVSI